MIWTGSSRFRTHLSKKVVYNAGQTFVGRVWARGPSTRGCGALRGNMVVRVMVFVVGSRNSLCVIIVGHLRCLRGRSELLICSKPGNFGPNAGDGQRASRKIKIRARNEYAKKSRTQSLSRNGKERVSDWEANQEHEKAEGGPREDDEMMALRFARRKVLEGQGTQGLASFLG